MAHNKVNVICENLCLEEGMTKEQIERTFATKQVVNSLASGSPKSVYNSVSDLKSANPDTGVYIVYADGHIYSWTKNGSDAIDLGIYQSTGISENDPIIQEITTTLNNHEDELTYSVSAEETETSIDLTSGYTDGKWISIDTNNNKIKINTLNNYQYHEFDVKANQKYRYSGRQPSPDSNKPAIIFADNADNVISSIPNPVVTGRIEETFTIPTGATKMYITHQGSADNSSEYYSWYLYKLEKEKTMIKERLIEDEGRITALENSSNNNPLYGKKIVCNGDSITKGQGYYGDTHGDKSYVDMIAERNNMTCVNYAVSGGTIASGSSTTIHHICDDIVNMDSDADYIIVSGGYNDYSYNLPLGVLSEDYTSQITKTNVIGGTEELCRNLLSRYKGKKIGFVFTHKIKQSPYTENNPWSGSHYTMTQCHDAIKSVLEKYSIPYCDLYNESTLNTVLDDYLQYTANNDGTHPTEQGYNLFYCDKVEAFLRSL